MSTYTIANVSGLPAELRSNGTKIGEITLIGQVTCYNQSSGGNDDDDHHHGHTPSQNMLFITAKVHIACSGYQYTDRSPIQVRVSAKTQSGNDVSTNPNELSNGLLIKCGNNDTDHEFTFQCVDHYSGGSASELVQIRFSFFCNEGAWQTCS